MAEELGSQYMPVSHKEQYAKRSQRSEC